MKKLTVFIASLVLFSVTGSLVSGAGFMKIGDIKGESIDKSNATEVGPIRWMAPESMKDKRASGGGTVSFTKRIDKSSPMLARTMSSGSEIEEMALADDAKQYILKNVTVVSIQKKGKQEVVTLKFQHRQEFGQAHRAAPANHNTTRSNRLAPAAAPAQDYNSSRSNRGG